jgi:hypothetical protein
MKQKVTPKKTPIISKTPITKTTEPQKSPTRSQNTKTSSNIISKVQTTKNMPIRNNPTLARTTSDVKNKPTTNPKSPINPKVTPKLTTRKSNMDDNDAIKSKNVNERTKANTRTNLNVPKTDESKRLPTPPRLHQKNPSTTNLKKQNNNNVARTSFNRSLSLSKNIALLGKPTTSKPKEVDDSTEYLQVEDEDEKKKKSGPHYGTLTRARSNSKNSRRSSSNNLMNLVNSIATLNNGGDNPTKSTNGINQSNETKKSSGTTSRTNNKPPSSTNKSTTSSSKIRSQTNSKKSSTSHETESKHRTNKTDSTRKINAIKQNS